jgi:hypothetical protein
MLLNHQNQKSPSRSVQKLEVIGNNFLNQSLPSVADAICAIDHTDA